MKRRRDQVLEHLDGVDALLVTDLAGVRYLTGFTGSNGQLLLHPDGPLFFTDGRYDEQASSQVGDLDRRIYSGKTKLTDLLSTDLAERGVSRLGVESADLTMDQAERFREGLEGVEIVATKDVVSGVRQRKDADEIARVRRAQRVAEDAVTSVLAAWTGGTELELALALEWAIRTGGAEGVSFEVIVASGPHAALPHATPRDEPIADDGVLLIDIGAVVDGYCSDMTRTYLGPGAPQEIVDAHAAVVRALEAGCGAIREGVKAVDVDTAARSSLEADGLGDAFVHSTGHGVGLEIHEGPTLSPSSEDTLEAGMVVTVEPGVYLPGIGGVRVEDLLVVTETGADNLTDLPRGPERPT